MPPKKASKKQVKIALLIASPHGKLKGPVNDANRMQKVLEKLNFDIIPCYGDQATKQNILDSWETLISRLQEAKTDGSPVSLTAVIYYAGHGGLVEAPNKNSREYQFLVPYDYSSDDEDDFKGILDIQISHLLSRMTKITKNVTVILDCCHAGRMARDPTHASAQPRSIGSVKHKKVKDYIKALKDHGELRGRVQAYDNPDVVRVVAAASIESAWEFETHDKEFTGALTNHLVAILEKLPKLKISWRTMMLRVRELVNVEFPAQHPHVEGPYKRFLFSVDIDDELCHSLFVEDKNLMMRAGLVAGVKEGDEYVIMPPNHPKPNSTDRLCRAKVVWADATTSRLECSGRKSSDPAAYSDAIAFLKKATLHRWVVDYPSDDSILNGLVSKSKYLRPGSEEDSETWLIRISQEGSNLCIYDRSDILLGSVSVEGDNGHENAAKATIKRAEALARGQHLLSLNKGIYEEELQHGFEFEAGIVVGPGNYRGLPVDGSASITEGEKLYVVLHNNGSCKIYVNVFDINVQGQISLISGATDGNLVAPGRKHVLGESRGTCKGLEIAWPKDTPKRSDLRETLVFIVSSEPMDLRHLESKKLLPRGDHTCRSRLELITNELVEGEDRDVEKERSRTPVQYDVIRMSFTLCKRS